MGLPWKWGAVLPMAFHVWDSAMRHHIYLQENKGNIVFLCTQKKRGEYGFW